MGLEAYQKYWSTDECSQNLERSRVCRALLLRWAKLDPLPQDIPAFSTVMVRMRQFFMSVLKQGDHALFHNSWAKVCALLVVCIHKLVDRNSALLQDPVLLAVVVMGIARKDEMQCTAGCWDQLLNVASEFEEQLGLPPTKRTRSQLTSAEFDVLTAIDFEVPQTDTYTIISAMLLRADIITMGDFKPLLEQVWSVAVQKAVRSVLWGQAGGYASAQAILHESLRQCSFPAEMIDDLFKEVAPTAMDVEFMSDELFT
jgi:hypothetical protein